MRRKVVRGLLAVAIVALVIGNTSVDRFAAETNPPGPAIIAPINKTLPLSYTP